jgi:hypothetical protein
MTMLNVTGTILVFVPPRGAFYRSISRGEPQIG